MGCWGQPYLGTLQGLIWPIIIFQLATLGVYHIPIVPLIFPGKLPFTMVKLPPRHCLILLPHVYFFALEICLGPCLRPLLGKMLKNSFRRSTWGKWIKNGRLFGPRKWGFLGHCKDANPWIVCLGLNKELIMISYQQRVFDGYVS